LHYSDRGVSSRDADVPIPGEKFSKLNVLALAPGRYSFFIVGAGGLVDRLKTPIPFTIKPGRVTYLGEIELAASSGLRYRLVASDQQARDLPLLSQHWPAFVASLVDADILRLP
jgi:hypothetical protein